jgi:hypothetical protein
MKQISVSLMVIASLLSGCSFNITVFTPPPPVIASETLPATQEMALPVATISATSEPPAVGFTPTTSEPIFYAAYASSDSRSTVGQSAFPAETKQVFAIWTYQNMHDGVNIKREWYLNGKPWLLREEPWDFDKYGEDGVMRDISIFDNAVGLPSGVYQLRMYIDDALQPIGSLAKDAPETWLNFEILPGEAVAEAVSPDSQWRAVVLEGHLLILRDINGTPTEIFDGREIPYLAWFPDNQHLLFVDRERTEQQEGINAGIRDDLWIVEMERNETRLVYESDTALGIGSGFVISPSSRYIASTEGSGAADACVVDTHLIFFEIAPNYRTVKALKQEQFAGITTPPDSSVYPTDVGGWENDNQFVVPLSVTCSLNKGLPGTYVFNMMQLTVAKK